MVKSSKKERLIEGSKYPLLARLIVGSMLKIEDEKRLPHHVRLDTCMSRGVAIRKIQPVIDNTIEECLHSVVGNTYHTLTEKSLQQQLKTYLTSVRD